MKKISLHYIFAVILLNSCTSGVEYIFIDSKMENSNWTNYQGPETNKLNPLENHQVNCRYVVDSKPSYGGIINSKPFEMKAGKRYEINFKTKVIKGTITSQLIQYDMDKANVTTLKGIKENNWVNHKVIFNSSFTTPINKINFTNVHSGPSKEPAEFYVDDVYIRTF